jgi:hypothetical protein
MKYLYNKLSILHFFTFISISFFTLFTFTIKNTEFYYDAHFYLLGYNLISTSNGFFNIFNEYYGSGSEILLSFIYLLLSLFTTPENIIEMITLNNIIFSLSLLVLISVIFFKRKIIGLNSRQSLTLISLILALMPLGAASQLARQAFTIVILASFVIYFYRSLVVYLFIPVVSVFSHFGSFITVYPFLAFLRSSVFRINFLYILTILLLLYIISTFFLDTYFLFKIIEHPTMRFKIGEFNISSVYNPAILFNILGSLFLIKNKKLKFLIIVYNILYLFYPVFFFTRVFWGLIFLFFPMIVFISFIKENSIKAKKYFYTKLVFIEVYIFSLLFLKLGVIIWKTFI